MTLPNILTSIGLILDILGVIMLFMYGLPSNVKENGSGFGGSENEEQRQKRLLNNKTIKMKAQFGLGLLITGFLFQLLANFIPALLNS
jgi:hypothetical protein